MESLFLLEKKLDLQNGYKISAISRDLLKISTKTYKTTTSVLFQLEVLCLL